MSWTTNFNVKITSKLKNYKIVVSNKMNSEDRINSIFEEPHTSKPFQNQLLWALPNSKPNMHLDLHQESRVSDDDSNKHS